MAELSAPLGEWLAQAIPQEARLVHKNYLLIPIEDYEQEMWTGVLTNPRSLEELFKDSDLGKLRFRLREFAYKLINEDDRYRRTIKAANAGYRPYDEQFYNLRVLKVLIPYYLDGGVISRPPRGREQPKVSGGSGSSDYFAMMLDLDAAWYKVKHYHRDILRRYYEFPQGSGGFTHLEISGRLGIPPDALRMRRDRALRALMRQLGGKTPWKRGPMIYGPNGSL